MPFHYLIKFWKIPRIEKKMLFIGFFFMVSTFIMVYTLPIRNYLFHIKSNPNAKGFMQQGKAIKLSRLTLKRLESILPWNCSCYVKSIVFNHLLSFLGIQGKIILGLRKRNESIFEAHSYVKIDDIKVYLNSKINEVYII